MKKERDEHVKAHVRVNASSPPPPLFTIRAWHYLEAFLLSKSVCVPWKFMMAEVRAQNQLRSLKPLKKRNCQREIFGLSRR